MGPSTGGGLGDPERLSPVSGIGFRTGCRDAEFRSPRIEGNRIGVDAGNPRLEDCGERDGALGFGDRRTLRPGGEMAALEDRITVNPKQCGGRPCIRGMRIRVSDVLDLLAAGLSQEEILDEHPDLEAEDIEACLRFASRRLDHPIVAA